MPGIYIDMGLEQVEPVFSSFFAKFLKSLQRTHFCQIFFGIFADFSKWSMPKGLRKIEKLKNHQIYQNFEKNEEPL